MADAPQHYERVFGLLSGVQSRAWGWHSLCPAHDDRKHSLSLKVADDGRLLVNCHAGCSYAEIKAALRLEDSAFFPPREGRRGSMGKIVATYDYKDAKGRLLYQVCRFEPKDFRPRRKARQGEQGKDGWVWNLERVQRVLYRLPEMLLEPGKAVFIVEGEKTVDRLFDMGFLATTNAGGAGKWRDDYNSALKGRDLVIVPDLDPVDPKTKKKPGWEHAMQVAASVCKVAKSVRVLLYGDTAKKMDLDDWLDEGIGPEELKAAVKSKSIVVPQAGVPEGMHQRGYTGWPVRAPDGSAIGPPGGPPSGTAEAMQMGQPVYGGVLKSTDDERDEIAKFAMMGALAGGRVDVEPNRMAYQSYELAEAMMNEGEARRAKGESESDGGDAAASEADGTGEGTEDNERSGGGDSES